MFDDRWFHVTWFLTYLTFDAILGHIFDLDEIYKSSRSYMITPTWGMHTETRTCSLSYHDLPGEPILSDLVRCTLLTFRCPHASSLRYAFWYVGWIQLWIWMIGITHLMIDYLMLSDFWLIPHLIPYWGIFSFWLRFIYLHWATWSLPLAGCTPRRGCVSYFIMVP